MKAGSETLQGIIDVTRKGVGYFAHEKYEEDVEIAPEDLTTALNGDEVEITLLGTAPVRAHRGGKKIAPRIRGKVLRVIKRETNEFVGTLEKTESGAFILKADDPRMYAKIRIALDAVNGATEGDKVVAHLERWENAKADPVGHVVRTLGRAGAHETEMQAALATHGFVPDFPLDVLREANELEKKPAITDAEIAVRRDFRAVPTMTIDPKDAKDFDDALSVRTLENGDYEIGIHIADVTHYVRPGTALDREGARRATSVYLVDRTIPMLPEVLSNDLCSLKPNVDRLAFSAVFTMDAQAHIQERWFGRTVIHSARRYTYEDAQETLNKNAGDFKDELKTLERLGHKLRAKREREGALSFDTPEVRFELAAGGTPIRAFVKERLETMRIVEDWMLLANQEVATWIEKLSKEKKTQQAFIYRVHDMPNPDRVEELRIFLRAVGYDLGRDKHGQIASRDINKLLADIKGKPEELMIQMATLRTMAKAVYSHKNIGHFSLAFGNYTHFTSPIRRYPDMIAHRLLAHHLKGEPVKPEEIARYQSAAITSSEREVAAAEAERDSTKFKQVEYMSKRVGQNFNGTVTGVIEHGLFVAEDETRAEGFVHVSALSNDYYELNERTYTLVGRKTKKKYRLGDKVKIKLLEANLPLRQLSWQLA